MHSSINRPPHILYHASPRINRESIAERGLSIGADNTGFGAIFLTDTAPPCSPLLDVYAVDIRGLDIELDTTTDAPDGECWYAVYEDIPIAAMKQLGQPQCLRPHPLSASFARWFSGSKAVDKDGRPVIAFHGTNADFDSFKVGGAGKTHGTGAFFSSSPEVAATYTGGVGGHVMPVYLSLRNPVIVECHGANWQRLGGNTMLYMPRTQVSTQEDDDLYAALTDTPARVGASKFLPANKATLAIMFPDELKHDDFSTDDLARWARQKGYESIIFKNVRDQGATGSFASVSSKQAHTVYTAFSPDQIRSVFTHPNDFDRNNNYLVGRSPQEIKAITNSFLVEGLDRSAKEDQAALKTIERAESLEKHLSNMTPMQKHAFFKHALVSHLNMPIHVAHEHADAVFTGLSGPDITEQIISDLGSSWSFGDYCHAETSNDRHHYIEHGQQLSISF